MYVCPEKSEDQEEKFLENYFFLTPKHLNLNYYI